MLRGETNRTALLNRKNKKSWLFVWDDDRYGYIHTTKYGTVYQLWFELGKYPDVFVARHFFNDNTYADWNTELQADSIEVANVIIKFK